jgi:anhydro-N-acetylmuramic acid kinase
LKENFYIEKMETSYTTVGIMSGTSLDGLDVSVCTYTEHENSWSYSILHAETVAYSGEWKSRLEHAHRMKSQELIQLDREYGTFIGGIVKDILDRTKLKPLLIASHGHTVFHAPSIGYTLQIGHGSTVNIGTGLPVVCDFRSADIALGGQGAPLVPIGDKLLFSEYEACLNLGGFANISFDMDGLRRACDICPVNIILNRFAESVGLPYDKDGILGREGTLNQTLFDNLTKLDYYRSPLPKSLSREWLEQIFISEIGAINCPEPDKIHTIYLHIAEQIAKIIEQHSIKKVLVTGGGAYNNYLLDLIKKNTRSQIILPDSKTIEFKEAIVFGFLGLLKHLNRINCLASVTGAAKDSSCGAIYNCL